MSDPDDLTFDAEQFSGRARLFPLPNLVLYPHVMQPLHIFEPRYRTMMEEAIADDHLIALAQFAPGWERDYEGRPPLLPIACLGKIATHQRLEDDRFNLLLLGVSRIRIVRELAPTKLFREAEVEVCRDRYPAAGKSGRGDLQKQLVAEFHRALPSMAQAHEQLRELLSSNVPLGVLTDIVSYTVDVGFQLKQQLLAETNVDERAALLIRYFGQATEQRDLPRGKFPPPFSEN